MADVLSQTEVESLLSALDPTSKNASPTDEKKSKRRKVNAPISAYDFKRPERVSKEQMRAFQALHEGFSREFGAALSGMLRTIVEVKLISVDQLTYSEFVFSLENPTCFNLVESTGLDGHIILDLNPSIIFPIVDRLLGGGKESRPTYPSRALTDIEVRLVSRITDLVISRLENTWSNICELGLRVTQTESNPQLVQIVPPNEVVVLISFELSMGDVRGIINLCIPFNAVEPLSNKLTSDTWSTYSKREADPRQIANLETGVASSAVELTAILAKSKLTVNEVNTLGIGDIIMTDHQVQQGVELLIEGQPMFEGSVGTYHGHKAVMVEKRIIQAKDLIDEKLAKSKQPAESVD
ncbi:MAG: flagellar motor switch protein FliM [Planctomycetaceae bacterium]